MRLAWLILVELETLEMLTKEVCQLKLEQRNKENKLRLGCAKLSKDVLFSYCYVLHTLTNRPL